MAGKASSSTERIIPIRMEESDEFTDDEDHPQTLDSSMRSTSSTEAQANSSREEDSTPMDNGVDVRKNLPSCNVKEKIIIVIDTAEDENVTPFIIKGNNKTSKPLIMMKNAVEMFINLKYLTNQNHEYALVILNENSAVWLLSFTKNLNVIFNTLQNVIACDAEDIFNLNDLFQVILEKTDVPKAWDSGELVTSPPYVVRTILFYGRSYTLPKIQKTKEIQELLESPYYTLDVLMTHEPVGVDNNCNKIFHILQNLDQKGFAYFFPVGRDVRCLQEAIGKLLGHPLQRPTQSYANYSLKKYEL